MSKIAIHGLGYVGITAAVHWAKAGWTVYAYDLDTKVIQALRNGTPRAGEFLAYLDADVARLVAEEKILPTHTFGDTLECEVHSIAIPTERDGKPWDDGVLALLKQLIRAMSDKGGMILVESTLTPGTMDRVLDDPALLLPEGLRDDSVVCPRPPLQIAVCPRRDWFADTTKNLATLDRIVGGLTPKATERAAELLSIVSKGPIHKCSYREAEFTKALENAWLHALVMLPTELATNIPGVDMRRVVEMASTHWRLPTIFLGAGCGGRCLAGHEVVVSRDEEGFRVETIQRFVERFEHGMQVLSRRADGQMEFKRVTRVGSREAATLRVTARGGHVLTMTEDHLHYVRRSGEEEVVAGVDLRQGDEFVFAGALPQAVRMTQFDLRNYARGAVLDGQLLTGHGAAMQTVPRVIEMDDAFAELLGYFAAEGWVSEEENRRRCGWAFHANEKDLQLFVMDALSGHGFTPRLAVPKKWQSVSIIVNHAGLAGLLLEHVGKDSYDVRVPSCVLGGQDSWRRAFLRGVIAGDGSISKSGQLEFYSASPALAQGVALLLRHFGLAPTFKQQPWRDTYVKYVVNAAGDEAREFLEGLLPPEKAKLCTKRGRRDRWGNIQKSPTHHRTIKKIEPADQQRVYSLDVEGNENFVTTGGVLTHNCVPLGTQYLLAASGPGGILEAVHTGERHIRVHVAEAIARRIRNVKNRRALVLGVAYRENFRDHGNSPGLDIAKYLRNDFGIETFLHDPMWSKKDLANLTGFECIDSPAHAPLMSAVFLATPHREYLALPDQTWVSKPTFILDAQGAWSRFEHVFRERGVEYKCVGSAGWR